MYLAFNHNGTLIGFSESAEEIFKEAKEYHYQTGNAYSIENDSDLVPLCPKCGEILSQADYHLSSPDYYGACLECDEDFYILEIKQFNHRQ